MSSSKMSENSVKAVAATKQPTVALATTSTSSASTALNSAEAAEASSSTPTSSGNSSTADGKQQTAASGSKRVIRTITVIDPRKLQQAGLDRKLAEAIGKQRLTATQTKPATAKAVTPKTQTTAVVTAVSKVATSTTPAAATVTVTMATVTTTATVATTATPSSSAAVTPQPSENVAAVATNKATVVKPLLKGQKVVPKITITRPSDSSAHPIQQLSTKTERLAQVKNLLQRKILTKLQPGSSSPSVSPLPTKKPPMPATKSPVPATPSDPTPPGVRVISGTKALLPVAPKSQTPPPPLVTATDTSTPALHSTHGRAAPKQPDQINITETRKLPLDVARINKYASIIAKAQQPEPRTHVQSYEYFLKNRLSGANIRSRVVDYNAGNDIADDDIPKASIKARTSLPPNRPKPSATAVKSTALEFTQMSPLKQPYPIVSLSQDTPLPNISTFKKPLPVTLTPTTKTASPECNTQQPAMKQYVKSLIVLENKVLSQDEKIDITALRLAKPKLETTATSSALAFAPAPTEVVVKEEQPEEFQYIPQQRKKESNVVLLPSQKLKLSQDGVPKQEPVEEFQATSQPNVKEPQVAALPLHKLPVPEDRVMKEAPVEERAAKPQNNAKKKVVLIPAHKLKLALKQVSQSTAEEFQAIPANIVKETKTVSQPSNKVKTTQDKVCNSEPASKLLPLQQPLMKEKQVFIFSPNKLKLSRNKIAAFAKEIKLQASTNNNKQSGAVLKTPSKSDTQSAQQQHSTQKLESEAANVLNEPLAKLEFKEPLAPGHKPLSAYSAAFAPRQKSTVEIVEQPQQESTLSAVDFIASLATTNPITEETELELSPEELNLNASFAMNLSPIRIHYPNEKSFPRESIDDSTNASEMLVDMFDSNADVEIGKIITIPADNVLNTVIADKSGQVITIASNKPLAIQSVDADVREANEDHNYQDKDAPHNANIESVEGIVSEKSQLVVALQQKELDASAQQTNEGKVEEINSNKAKQRLEFSVAPIQVSNAELNESLEELETEPAVVANAEVKQIVVVAEAEQGTTKDEIEESASEPNAEVQQIVVVAEAEQGTTKDEIEESASEPNAEVNQIVVVAEAEQGTTKEETEESASEPNAEVQQIVVVAVAEQGTTKDEIEESASEPNAEVQQIVVVAEAEQGTTKEETEESASEPNAQVKQIVVVAEAERGTTKDETEESASMSNLEKSNSNNDDSAAKRLPRFRKGKVNLVQRKRTNAANTTLPIADRRSKEFVDAADVSQVSEETASSRLTSSIVELQTADAVSLQQVTVSDADNGANTGSQLTAVDMLKSQSVHLTNEDAVDTNSAQNWAAKHTAAQKAGDKNTHSAIVEDELLPRPADVEASVVAEHATDDVTSNENATKVFEAQAQLVPNETIATTPETARKQQLISQLLNPPKLPKRKHSEKLQTTEQQSDSAAASISAVPIPINKTASLIQPKNDDCELVLTPAKNPFKTNALRGVKQIEKQSAIGIKTLLDHMELAKLDKVSNNSSHALSNVETTEIASTQDKTQPVAVPLPETETARCELALVADMEKPQTLPKHTLKRRASTRFLSNVDDQLCAKDELELCATTCSPKKTKLASEAAESLSDSVRITAKCLPSSLTEQPPSAAETPPVPNAAVGDTAHADVSPRNAPSETDQSSDHLLPVKRTRKRKRKALDDSKTQRTPQTQTESEDDRDMCDNEDAAAFLGFDDHSPASSKMKNKLELLITAASAEEASCAESNLTDKLNAHAVSGTTLKSWLTTGKAIAPTLTKYKEKDKLKTTPTSRAATVRRRSSVPLKKRWELLQNSQEQDIEITDDTSPLEDDEEDDKLHAAAVKRSCGERPANAKIAVKKLKFSEASVEEGSLVDTTLDRVDSSETLDKKNQNTVSDEGVGMSVAASLPQQSESDLAKDISVKQEDEKLRYNSSRVQKQETEETTPLPEPSQKLKTSLVHESKSRSSVDAKLSDKTPPTGTKSKADGNSKSIIEYFESHERRSAKIVAGANEETAQQSGVVNDFVPKDSNILKSEVLIQNKKRCRKSATSASDDLKTDLKPILPETAEKLLSINKDSTETHKSSTSVVEKKKSGRKSKSPAAATIVESKAILSVRTDLMEDPQTVSVDPIKKSRRKSKFLETVTALEPKSNTVVKACVALGVVKKNKSNPKSTALEIAATIDDGEGAGTSNSCSKVDSDLIGNKESVPAQKYEPQTDSSVTASEKLHQGTKNTASDAKKNSGRKSKPLESIKSDTSTFLNSTVLDYENTANEEYKPSAEGVATREKKPNTQKAKSPTTLAANSPAPTNALTPDNEESAPVKLKKKPGRKPKSTSTPSALEQNADSTSNTNPNRDAFAPVLEKKKPGRKPKAASTVSTDVQDAESTLKTADLPQPAVPPAVPPAVVEKKKPGRKPKLKPETPVQSVSLDTAALSQSEMSAPVVEKKKRGRKPKLKSPAETPIQNADSSTLAGTSDCETPAVVKKRPGRKSLDPASPSTISAPFNPRLLLITNRAQLDTDEPLTETADKVTKPGTVQCGLCLACVARKEWMQHLATHYGVGWIVGEMPEINLTLRNAVLNVMVIYMKTSSTKELTCRMCERHFRSALGALLHIEACGAPEVRVTCEYCSRDYSQLTIVSHRRTCAVRWESLTKDNEPDENSETTTTADAVEVFNNVGRVKRASVKKAEKRLKAIRHELGGAAATMSIADAKSHIKLEPPVGSDLEAKWNDDLQSVGVARCLAKKCSFECKDVPTMKTHHESCEYKAEVVYRCTLCSKSCMFPDEEAALKHVMHQHATNVGNDFDGDSTDCGIRTDQESSGDEDDGSSGVDSNESEIDGSAGSRHAVASTAGSRKKKSRTMLKLVKSSRPQVYPYRSHKIAADVANNWKQFVEANYSEHALFPYALPVYKNCCLEDLESYLPTQQASMKFSFVQRHQFPRTFGCAEQLTWTELDRFGTINSKFDHLLYLGGPVKTMAWVPLPRDVHEQYLLLGYRRDYHSYTRFQNPKIGTTLLLLFKITVPSNAKAPIGSQLHYAVSIPDGPVHCTTFLPSGGYDAAMNRLGLLAVGTATNTIKVYALPLAVERETPLEQHAEVKEAADEAAKQVTVIELKPVIVLCLNLDSASLRGHTLADTQCVQICWSETASHKHIFAGFSSGCVGIWDISGAGEEDNLNCFVLDGVRNFVPLNFFYLTEKVVRAMALHYDTAGPRWLAAIVGIRKVLCYDLRDLTQPILLMDECSKNATHSLDWSPLWEPFVTTVGDSLLTYGRFLQAVHVNNLQVRGHTKIDNTPRAAAQLHYNPMISVLACTSDNGDVVYFNTRELNQIDVLRKSQQDGRVVSSIDLKRLDGTAMPKFDSETQPPAGWQPNEPDYKQKYGLAFGPVLKCETKDKTHYMSEERMPHVSLERYLRASSMRWNLNSSARQLLAVGYDNGFVRLTNFKPQLYFKR